eukprot:1172798-Rhodomonas_salina.7
MLSLNQGDGRGVVRVDGLYDLQAKTVCMRALREGERGHLNAMGRSRRDVRVRGWRKRIQNSRLLRTRKKERQMNGSRTRGGRDTPCARPHVLTYCDTVSETTDLHPPAMTRKQT